MHFIYIINKYLARTTIWMKEKYGTIRYECTWAWGISEKSSLLARYQVFILKLSVMLATLRYRSVKEEICEDFICMWDNVKEGQVPWYCKFGLKENPWRKI